MTRSTSSTSASGSAPSAMTSTSVIVRKMAIGSLVPDFDFERRAHAVAQIDVAGAQQEEHRRRIGGGDRCAEQEGFQPVKVRSGRWRRRRRCTVVSATPTVASDKRRQRRLPEHVERRAEAGIEQDDGQRQRADEIGELGVVEFDAEPVGRRWPGRWRGRAAAAARRSGRRSGSKTRRRAPARCRPALRDISPDPSILSLISIVVVALRALRHSAAKTRRAREIDSEVRQFCVDTIAGKQTPGQRPGVSNWRLRANLQLRR